MTWRAYVLTVGLPQTNARGLSETRLLMEAGHMFWQALGEELGGAGLPVAQLARPPGVRHDRVCGAARAAGTGPRLISFG